MASGNLYINQKSLFYEITYLTAEVSEGLINLKMI